MKHFIYHFTSSLSSYGRCHHLFIVWPVYVSSLVSTFLLWTKLNFQWMLYLAQTHPFPYLRYYKLVSDWEALEIYTPCICILSFDWRLNKTPCTTEKEMWSILLKQNICFYIMLSVSSNIRPWWLIGPQSVNVVTSVKFIWHSFGFGGKLQA